MTSLYGRSKQLYDRALRVLPGGISRNSILRRPYPFYVSHGQGCHVTDVDGITRIDFANNMASLIHGHADPLITQAVARQLSKGTAFNLATEAEIELAEHLIGRSKSFEKIRFVNSGSEAIMCCLKAARAFTQRPKIAKVEGAYHGIYDYAEVSQTAQPSNWGDPGQPNRVPVVRGTPASALEEVIIIPFNNPEAALAILDQHAAGLAGVLVDPMPHRVGFIPATRPFIAALRQWTQKNGALLIFDEVITFRSSYGGAQEWFDARPDLTAMGKMIGGGFPVGAIAGRGEVMEVFNPLADKILFPLSGTFSANPVTMVAGRAALEKFDREMVTNLNRLGDIARRQIEEAIRAAEIPACVTGAGSIFRIHFKPAPPRNYRESYCGPNEMRLLRVLLDEAWARGIILISTGSGALSTPMGQAEIDRLCEVLQDAFHKMKTLPAELAAAGQTTGSRA